MKNTELSQFLKPFYGLPLLGCAPAPGGGIALHFESKYFSGQTDTLTITPDTDFDGTCLKLDISAAKPDCINYLPQ